MNLVAHKRHGRGDVRSHRNGPVRQLIPRKQVTRITKEERHQQKDHSDHPVEFAWSPVGSAIKNFEHVRKDQENHAVRRPAVQIAKKHSGGNHELQIFRIRVSLRSRRMVVEHQRDSGRDQDEERPQREGA